MKKYPSRWHGKKFYFGLHYDLHASKADTDLGTRCSPKELATVRIHAAITVETVK